MKINHELPVFDIVVNPDDNTGFDFISLVDDPAIEMKGFAFRSANIHDNCKCEIIDGEFITEPDACEYCLEKKDEYNRRLFKSDKDKQVIVGPALIPNKLIYRKDEDGEYYVKFTEQVIRQMADKFMKGNNIRRINVDHSNTIVEGYIQQFWIVEDSVYDKSRFYGLTVPKGTLMVEVKIEDTKFWKEEVKGNGKFGFSVEGLMGQRLVKMNKEETIEETIDSMSDEEILDLFNFFIKQNEI
jgi:hypothetical protein